MLKKVLLLISFFIFNLSTIKSQNLLNNGDFESGGNGAGRDAGRAAKQDRRGFALG